MSSRNLVRRISEEVGEGEDGFLVQSVGAYSSLVGRIG